VGGVSEDVSLRGLNAEREIYPENKKGVLSRLTDLNFSKLFLGNPKGDEHGAKVIPPLEETAHLQFEMGGIPKMRIKGTQ